MYLKFIESAEYLATIPKYGVVDETGGVCIDRMVQRSTIMTTVDSAVTIDMNGDVTRTRNIPSINEVVRSNIKLQSAPESRRREGGSGGKIVRILK